MDTMESTDATELHGTFHGVPMEPFMIRRSTLYGTPWGPIDLHGIPWSWQTTRTVVDGKCNKSGTFRAKIMNLFVVVVSVVVSVQVRSKALHGKH